ncbi:MAG TPA: hypothetical protein VFV67_32085 [Actinophytocola sp.]|uniref:hypothetical protein n=1 Tax=Actinophytocola sp. TaxID=1872138 RepID=UPI002DB6C1B3|nr:hypothetical protein [Actinophytocola sp.]HEU5475306.1 hypothetical protein [Actinophytocola sp.]
MWSDQRTPYVLGEPTAPFGGDLARSLTHWLVRALLITLVIGFVIVRYAVRRYVSGELGATMAPGTAFDGYEPGAVNLSGSDGLRTSSN